MRAAPLFILAGLLTGCGPAVVGEWESREAVQNERNSLVVEEDFVADAEVWIFRTVMGVQQAQAFEYDVEWDERREGESYSFTMSCKESPYASGCDPEDDFRMVCDLEGEDEDQLACDVDDNLRWEEYEFFWQKLD